MGTHIVSCDFCDALKQQVAELENTLGALGIDYGHAQDRMEKNYVSAVNGRREFRSLAVGLRDKLTEAEEVLREVRKGIIDTAPDTVWVSLTCTAVDAIDCYFAEKGKT